MRSLVLAALAMTAVVPAVLPTRSLAQAQEQAPAPAQTAMTGAQFEAYTQGRTLSYSFQGTPYGIEQYLPNHRVRWAFVGQECQDGVWYERNGTICFLYDAAPDAEQCWTFHETDHGMRGVFQGPGGPSTELYEVEQSDVPLTCQGPNVGV